MPKKKLLGGSDYADTLKATTAVDVIYGFDGDDTFQFKYINNNNPKDDTLNHNDGIVDYEHGEDIKIDGIVLDSSNVSIEKTLKDGFRILIDTDDDGFSDLTITLGGIDKGHLSVSSDPDNETSTIVIYNDPIEHGDRDKILLIENTREENFTYIDKEEAALHAQFERGGEAFTSDFDFV